MTINEIQKEIIDEFQMFSDWTERYEHIIELGKTLPLIKEEEKTDDLLIKGCQSRVWLKADYKEDKIHLTSDSDAIITKGIIALLVRVYSNQTPEAIINSNVDFINAIGLKEHLSPTRANGLVSMMKQIKLYAVAYNAQHN